MKFFDKLDSNADLDNLVLNKKQVSNICAILIFLFMLVFSLGYFWGKKNSAEVFVDKAINDSFEDKVNYSLYSLYNNSNQEEDVIVEESSQEPQVTATTSQEPEIASETTAEQEKTNGPGYYAELIGFSTEKAANGFLEKAKAKNYPVKILTKKSVSPKGKSVTWYQARTEQMSDKAALEKLTKQIEKSERLSGTKIITIKS